MAVGAITGVLEAGRKPIGLFGVVLVPFASALGRGTVRDLILDREAFWVADEAYLVCVIGAGLARVFLVCRFRLPPNLFLLPDAVGLAPFTIVGTQSALADGVPLGSRPRCLAW